MNEKEIITGHVPDKNIAKQIKCTRLRAKKFWQFTSPILADLQVMSEGIVCRHDNPAIGMYQNIQLGKYIDQFLAYKVILMLYDNDAIKTNYCTKPELRGNWAPGTHLTINYANRQIFFHTPNGKFVDCCTFKSMELYFEAPGFRDDEPDPSIHKAKRLDAKQQLADNDD